MLKNFFIVAAMTAVAGAASAQTVNMHFLGVGEGRNVRISLDGDQRNVFAGELRHSVTASNTGEVPVGDYTTFCVDLAQYVSRNSSVFNVNPLSATPELVSSTPEAANRLASAAGSHLAGDTDSAAAVQLVLWELLYDFDPQVGIASLDLTAGRFSASKTNGNALWSSVSSIASSLLSTTMGDLPSNAAGNYRVLTSGDRQDQIVPVPSTGPLALAAVGGLLTVRRKRNG